MFHKILAQKAIRGGRKNKSMNISKKLDWFNNDRLEALWEYSTNLEIKRKTPSDILLPHHVVTDDSSMDIDIRRYYAPNRFKKRKVGYISCKTRLPKESIPTINI